MSDDEEVYSEEDEEEEVVETKLRCKYTGPAYDGLKIVILVHYKRRCSVHPLNSCVVC
jgi:hypothetical protein